MEEKALNVSELSDDELGGVTGGAGASKVTVKHKCDKCGKEVAFEVYSGGRAVCTICKTVIML